MPNCKRLPKVVCNMVYVILIDILNHSVLQGLLRKMAIYQQFSKSPHDGRL